MTREKTAAELSLGRHYRVGIEEERLAAIVMSTAPPAGTHADARAQFLALFGIVYSDRIITVKGIRPDHGLAVRNAGVLAYSGIGVVDFFHPDPTPLAPTDQMTIDFDDDPVTDGLTATFTIHSSCSTANLVTAP